jgi:hypothetical protein
VPPSVVELNSLGVISESAPRPFKRVQTAPPAVFSSHRSFFGQRVAPVRTQSQGLMIFLANNEIKVIPPEFFKLSNLTVLSLRAYLAFFFLCIYLNSGVGNNSLEDLPPEIAQLQALKDLDVVNNNLRFLPAEMTTMTLTNLNVHTNPWYADPAHTTSLPQHAPDGATRVHFRVPPLREVVLRYLLTPSANQQPSLAPTSTSTTMTVARARQPTTLEDRFQLPLQEGTLTPADAALFARLAPVAVSAPPRHAFSRATTSGPSAGLFSSSTLSKSNAERPTNTQEHQPDEQKGSGRCPSPRHCDAGSHVTGPWPWARLGPPFVLPAEERHSWVNELAGVRVGETTGGVPLLWRGCGPGCLDFLDGGKAGSALGEAQKEKNDRQVA